MKELVSIITPFGVDGEEAFVILSVRVLDDSLQVFSTRRDGSELCVEQSEQRVPLFFFFPASHAELGAVPTRIFHLKQVLSLKPLTEPEQLRLAIEELGPAFIKMGQILSLRPDIIPSEYAWELEKLQDRTMGEPLDRIKTVIEDEIGREISTLFASFEDRPVASGSIAQVHKAVLRNEREAVAVKVLKPGTHEIVRKNLSIMRLFVRLAVHYIPELKLYGPAEILQEFSEILIGDLNFVRVAQFMERFSHFFKGRDFVHIPRVYRDLTTPSVLVMEYIDGIKISDGDALHRAVSEIDRIENRLSFA